ncbi:MAG: DUF624 domain-containing protein [Oscillospiraceae bacterium]|nr:DUF624 domain-containing protein [Oscillospiraceae bacterium]
MRKLFDLENPVFQLISRLSDLVVAGLLYLACCIPVVTIGPAAAALFKTVYDLTLERGSGIVKTYFRAFRDNFRQALLVWLMGFTALAALVCDFLLLKLYYQGTAYTALFAMVAALAVLVGGMLCYLFPLIARYDNTLREHIRNALILTVRYFPKTLAMLLIRMLPLLTFWFMPEVFFQTLLLWILFAPGFSAQADAFLIRPVFEKLEAKPADETAQKAEEKEEGSETP